MQADEELTMKARMRLGDLLIQARLISPDQLTAALHQQADQGGRLGVHLVETGAISQFDLDAFLHRMPSEPVDIAATRIHENDLLGLLMKLIYTGHLETMRHFVDAIKLPYQVVDDLVRKAVDRQLLRSLGSRDMFSLTDTSYAVTEEGRRYTQDELQQCRYAGPAPVSLEEFIEVINLQKITNEAVTYDRLRHAFGDLVVDDQIVEKCGPALNSGRAMLLYGPPGNGKTSVALSFTSLFNDVIYVPYAIMVEGQIIRMYDPSYHTLRPTELANEDLNPVLIRREEYDGRWVPCQRPFIVAGGELTLDMLDLRYDVNSSTYEAPLHVKALGGCFIIDDFGRQLVSPTALLNRWIVPLENRIDYLKLHTGKSFTLPFEELVIFSTNLEPEELMDAAFLRRLPFKIEVGAPTLDQYREIFQKECARRNILLSPELFDSIVYKITQEKCMELAAYHPRFIVDQVAATCRFMGQPDHFEPRYVQHAVDNLRVHRKGDPRPTHPA